MKCVSSVSETFTWYGSNKTNVWQKILALSTFAFSCTFLHENDKNLSMFVNITLKKITT